MRKERALIFLLVLFLVPAIQAQDIAYDVNVNPTYMWNDQGTPKIMASNEFILEIQAINITGTNICDIANGFKIYGIGDVTEVIYTQSPDIVPGVERTGGFEPGGGIWVDDNQLVAVDMDGSLPDEFSFSGSGCATGSGWGLDAEMLTRFNLYMNVPFVDTLSEGEICIDSVEWGDPPQDWLFSPSVNVAWSGPYCWLVRVPVPRPYIIDAPAQLYTTHDVPFDIVLYAANAYADPIAMADATSGEVTILDWNKIRWTFDPPCDWASDGEDHNVVLTVSGSGGWYWGSAYIDLVVQNRQPTFDGPFGDTFFVGVDVENHAYFTASDPDTQDVHTWTVTPDPAPNGTIDISGGVITFIPTADDIGNVYEVGVNLDDCEKYGFQGGFFFNVVGYPMCGDVDYSGDVTILDIIYMIDRKFKQGPPFSPEAIGDVNNDGTFNVLDIIHMIAFKFSQGPAPTCPPF